MLPSDGELVSDFARLHGLDESTLVRMLTKALANHIRLHGPEIHLPLHLGLPSTHCHTCPFSRHPAPPRNIVTFPRS